MNLLTAIDQLPKSSVVTIRRLKKIGIKSYFDLLNYFPSRYEDYSLISKINQLQPEEKATITGRVVQLSQQISRRGLRIIIVQIADSSGKINLIFYNQPYLLTIFKKDQWLSFAGEVTIFNKKIGFTPSEYEVGSPKIHTGRIIPIYPEKNRLSSRTIREKIFFLLNQYQNEINEILPEPIIRYNQLIDRKQAYQNIHFPRDKKAMKMAYQRLAFDELFLLQLSARLTKINWEKEIVTNRFLINKSIFSKIEKFINDLPFKLTTAQIRVWREILSDLKKSWPMNRLLQGDVGSGKTVVAALAGYFAYLNGFQTLLMAPTEILAEQHLRTMSQLFKDYPLKIGLQTGSKKINKKETVNHFDIIIGTHALLNERLKFERVGLVIIDEQHRFGVEQRAKLQKKGFNPHLLTMTATPIPRTVALTLYGELEISVIDEMPPGRQPVKTYLIPKNKRLDCYDWIKKQIKAEKTQAFIVCPLIEESTVETMRSVRAAKKEFESLTSIFNGFRLGLLHGKMRPKEKEKIMDEFARLKIDILVTTPVVEVGIDIPNASIMIVEAAERFGLAQLHQLRGRIGRRNQQGYCFLFTEKESTTIISRLNFFCQTHNGLSLAEKDLSIRGPGDLYGHQQHGFVELKIASFNDYSLIERTKTAVNYFVTHYSLDQYSDLKKLIGDRVIFTANN